MKKLISNQKKIVTLMSISICSFIIFFSSCMKKESEMVVKGDSGTPTLPAMPYNYGSGQNNLATLGRVLFYDKNLSLNNAIACGSCHNQANSFADNHQFSRGLNNTYSTRNASAIVSSPFHSHFWDGRAANYDIAVFMPVMNHGEMDMFSLDILPAKLSAISYYSTLFNNAYGTSEITIARIRGALSEFVNDLSSTNSRFDRASTANTGQFNGNGLTAFEIAGWQLFNGKGKCINCHNGPNFNGGNQNIYENTLTSTFENIGLEVNYSDIGRGKITQNTADNGKFNIPTLLNIAVTAPYMHDGRYATLRQVIDHYSEGIQDSPNLSFHFRDIPSNLFTNSIDSFGFSQVLPPANFASFPVKPLSLTEQEKNNLEAFLNTLTDVNFLADPKFSNPFTGN